MRPLAAIGAFTLGLSCGIGGAAFVAYRQAPLAATPPGTEIVSILDDEVMSITFITEALTVVAQRTAPGAIFALQITYADGRPPRQCLSSPKLHGQITSYTTIRSKRQLETRQQANSEFPLRAGTLELRDRIAGMPAVVIALRANPERSSLAALYDDVAAEISNPPHAFDALEKGCDLLSSDEAPFTPNEQPAHFGKIKSLRIIKTAQAGPGAPEDSYPCSRFTPSRHQVRRYLQLAGRISENAAHFSVSDSPCHADAEVVFTSGQRARLSVGVLREGRLAFAHAGQGEQGEILLYCSKCSSPPFID